MPFTVDEFFAVFARYNESVGPLPAVAYILGLVTIALVMARSRVASMIAALILAAMWAVNGVGYHWLYFAEVNPAAWLFGAAFLAEAVLLATAPFVARGMTFSVRSDARSVVGTALILFSMVAYPVWGRLAGHTYPAVPSFGIAPCPTTIFTIGVLLLGPWKSVRWLLVIPVLWSVVGGSAAVLLRVPQDFGLIAAGLCAVVFALAHRRDAGLARHDASG